MKIYWIISFICYLFIHPFVWAVIKGDKEGSTRIAKEIASFISAAMLAIFPILNIIMMVFGVRHLLGMNDGLY